jgi:hypothetical protein
MEQAQRMLKQVSSNGAGGDANAASLD